MRYIVDVELNKNNWGSKWLWRVKDENADKYALNDASGTAFSKNRALKRAVKAIKHLEYVNGQNSKASYVFDTVTMELTENG